MKTIFIVLWLIIIFSQLYATLDDGLVAYYPFNGNSNDESGNGNHGNVFGATLSSDRFGSENSAYLFDGNDYIDCGNSNDFNLMGSIASSCWIYFNSGFTSAYIYDKGTGPGYDHPYGVHITLSSINSMLNGENLIYNYNFQINHWYHIVCSYDMSSQKLYVNGQLIGDISFSEQINVNQWNFQIGRRLPDNYYFSGKIDDLRIYNRALSESEVAILYGDYYNVNANFEAGQTSVNLGNIIQFTDLSAGNPTSWEWDFDNDGTIDSYEQNPTFIYTETGTYTVSLTVSNASTSDSEIKTNYITVNEFEIESPLNIAISIVGDDVLLTWDSVTGADSYSIYRSPQPDFGYIKIDTITNTSYLDIGANSEKHFYYYVKANWLSAIDIDGNIYQTVQIGDQIWMAENLKVTHYRNGDVIPNITNNDEWGNLSTGAYGVYDNISSNADTFGYLYNWYAVDDSRNIAPEGWHVPTDEEIKQLEIALGMSQSDANNMGWRGTNEGSKLAGRADLWYDGILESNIEFGSSNFNIIPAGYRSPSSYGAINEFGFIWSSTETGSDLAWSRLIRYTYTDIYRDWYGKSLGFPVRCVKD